MIPSIKPTNVLNFFKNNTAQIAVGTAIAAAAASLASAAGSFLSNPSTESRTIAPVIGAAMIVGCCSAYALNRLGYCAQTSKGPSVREARRQLTTVGASKANDKAQNRTDTDLIVRTVMRHPNERTKQVLCKVHQQLNAKFGGQSEEALEWLLGGSSGARGGFKDAAALRNFLAKDPATIPPSRLITGLETLLAVIAYRNIGHPACKAPVQAETVEQHKISAICKQANQYWVADMLGTYTDRVVCKARKHTPSVQVNPDAEFLADPHEEVSDDSDCENPVKPPKPSNPPNVFLKKDPRNGNETWVSTARQQHVPVCATPSGSTPLCLSVAEWLLADEQGKVNPEDLRLVAGVILAPAYHRAGYHTHAETTAGYLYHKACRANEPRQVISPQVVDREGFSLLRDAADEQYQAAIETLAREIPKSRE